MRLVAVFVEQHLHEFCDIIHRLIDQMLCRFHAFLGDLRGYSHDRTRNFI
jgi:hypothetical protein